MADSGRNCISAYSTEAGTAGLSSQAWRFTALVHGPPLRKQVSDRSYLFVQFFYLMSYSIQLSIITSVFINSYLSPHSNTGASPSINTDFGGTFFVGIERGWIHMGRLSIHRNCLQSILDRSVDYLGKLPELDIIRLAAASFFVISTYL